MQIPGAMPQLVWGRAVGAERDAFVLVMELGSVTHPSSKLCFAAVNGRMRPLDPQPFHSVLRASFESSGALWACNGCEAKLRRWARNNSVTRGNRHECELEG